MSDQAQDIPTLTVDGTNFPVHGLPEDIRELISVYQECETTLGQQKKEAFKTEAAMRAISSEIQTRVRSMIAMRAAEEADAPRKAEVDPSLVESEGGTPD